MAVSFARPNVAELMFRVYSRSLHPELFQVHAQTQISQPDYNVTLQICDAGHLVSFSCGGEVFSEVTATRQHPLPEQRRMFARQFRGNCDEAFQLQPNLAYQVSFQLEHLEPEVFLNFNEELLVDCKSAELARSFQSSNRLAPGPLSLIKTDVWPKTLLIHAYHTFPENCAVVKTQSLFELK